MTDQSSSAEEAPDLGTSHIGTPHERSWTLPLPHKADSVPLARAIVQQVLHGLGDPVDSFAASLAATELVANALEHTPGDGEVELVLDWEPPQGFRIEVCDEEPLELDLADRLHGGPGDSADSAEPAALVGEPGEPGEPSEPAEDGRGLLIIRSVADRAGIRTTSHGKAVWCLLEPA
ncbi:ATP-binding protein [Peterkaempfera bronchialis]|uniref:ATP-binding protein n=1 Tax=Peterkaempfera bronchialis TaxID=2126346 RepID=A0A345T1L2_9ACTN|nr:ATP-binding protein [Peterkaempfera bronchialis]AXI79867.1 ATP-binding protein [Peterkaempfera bronchialis]